MSTSLVSVNHFSECPCQDLRFPTFHLASRTFWLLDLNQGRAVAISYAIGDYGRAYHILGHRDGALDLAVSLQFGVEWDMHDLKHLLVELSQTNQAIWIEQLSIPQTSQKEIRTHLERIPDIYGTLEAIILLPNAPCHCLQESLNAYEEGVMFLAQDRDFDILKVSTLCIGAIPLCSYYLRLWTKREFTYAKIISVRWASGSKSLCSRQMDLRRIVKSSTLSHLREAYMNPYARYHYEAVFNEATAYGEHADDVVWSQFRILIDDIRSALINAVHIIHMLGTPEDHDLYHSQHTFLYVARMLPGQVIIRKAHKEEGHFIHFDGYNSGHRAKIENDYALAVFPSHNSYHIPVDCR